MNVYDFDKTIYRNDSTFDFIMYCFKRHPKTLINLPRTMVFGLGFFLHIVKKTTFKQNMYHMFKYLDNIDDDLDKFTDSNMHKIKSFYLENKKDNDLIISASPTFLVQAFCKKLGDIKLLASVVDKQTGKYTGLNCHGEEKVRRFYETYPQGKIDEFYSDSYSDTPLAKLATKAYIVKGDNLKAWDKY